MKFTCTVDINASKEKVANIFADPSKLQHFQDGFKSKELLSGNAMTEGSKSKLVYEKLELIETIQLNNLPEEFQALYEHKHMVNTMKVKFTSLDSEKTRYTSEIHYTKFNGFLIKMMAKLFPGMFKKQVNKWLVQFKTYVEAN